MRFQPPEPGAAYAAAMLRYLEAISRGADPERELSYLGRLFDRIAEQESPARADTLVSP